MAAVSAGPRKPLSEDQKKRLNELKRSKNKLDAVLADPNATQEEKDAARRRYELAKENSKDIFQVDGQVEEKNTSLEEQKKRAAPKLQQAPTGEERPDLTSNPDATTYEESWSGRNIGGEPYVPGKQMTDTQIAAIQARLAMSNENTYPESVMKDYNASIAARQTKEAEAAQRDLDNPDIRGRMTEEERAEAEKKAKQQKVSDLKKQTDNKTTEKTNSGGILAELDQLESDVNKAFRDGLEEKFDYNPQAPLSELGIAVQYQVINETRPAIVNLALLKYVNENDDIPTLDPVKDYGRTTLMEYQNSGTQAQRDMISNSLPNIYESTVSQLDQMNLKAATPEQTELIINGLKELEQKWENRDPMFMSVNNDYGQSVSHRDTDKYDQAAKDLITRVLQ
jgi:hypothetical protein